MSDRMMLINWGANKKLVRIKENPVPGESLFNIFLEEDGERFGYTLTSNGVMTRGATEGLDKIVARFEHEIGNLSAWLLPGSEPFHAHVYSPFRGIIEFIPVKGRGYYLPEVKELICFCAKSVKRSVLST